jgi:peptide/nickel transport system substrate-binding protein
MPSIMTEPWNPIAGSNWVYDAMPIRGTGEFATVNDPFTGLNIPNRIERAEVTVEEGLPVGTTLDWVTLEFAEEIKVPEDAWADWDAAEQRWITVGEKFPEGVTVKRKSVVYYPEDLYDTVKWHDGSPFDLADIIMAMILSFDQAKPESPYYDEAQVPSFESFIANFKGVRIVSEDPLVIETYSDFWLLDAEEMVDTWWPMYSQGPGAWHNLAIGLMAEAAGEAAFSNDKAEANEVEWLSYIAGPTIEILKAKLDEASEAGFIPYEATLGQYVSADEAAARYANLAEWFRRRGHFWIGTGPFYLERAFPVEGTLILRRNPDHPDLVTRWLRFSEPAIAEVAIEGPSQVKIGEEATFDIKVTFKGEPYAIADVNLVKFLVFDATGALATKGDAEAVEDGLWRVTLSADVTGALAEGSNQLQVVVGPLRVLLPTIESVQFVTTP